ncbi:DUF1775 domain-containing protein [Micromonospora sp. NBC_01813]|uniref:DUF1775 domain-containing protein n=1 Tax=Micromonospora sp. NBC_01813 TaxID=2975988 RepID=UPI002DDAF17D|nr:DUF1775 domain-containing protein [Micromonospora sp. NBC_01813]WSA12269.1 YcnI family protein [Micromonospora sp. NBC_01813]
MKPARRRAVALVAAATLTIAPLTAASIWLAAPAAAHTQLAAAQPNGAGATTLTFTFDHGCDNADTTELAVDMPDGAIAGAATGQPAGWSADVTPRRVVWTGPAIDAAQIAAGDVEFAVLVRLTGTVGQTFWFPSVQRCADGDSYDWLGAEPDAERPAPSLIATNAVLAPLPVAVADEQRSSGGGASLPQAVFAVGILVAGAGLAGYRLTGR